MVKAVYQKVMGDSLYQNSLYLMLSTLVLAIVGFFFWLINAQLFTPEQIGIATTLISVATLIASFSLLGLTTSLVHYIPTSIQKNKKINTSITLVTVTALVLAIGYLAGIHIFSPKLAFVRCNVWYSIIFVLVMVFYSLNYLVESVFIAYHSSKYILIKNIIFGSVKMFCPLLFIALGAYAIFLSYGIGYVVACLVSLIVLIGKFKFVFRFGISPSAIKRMRKFATGNYIVGFISWLPLSVLPILITNNINPTTSAYFYMDMMIAGLLYIIPYAAAQTLLAEASVDMTKLHSLLKRTIAIITVLLIPAVLICVLFGKYILLAFGSQYVSGGFFFLQLIAVSGIFIAISYVGNTILNLKHKVHYIIGVNIVYTIIVIAMSYLLIRYQLTGIGIAWLTGNAICAGLYLLLIRKYL